MKPVELVLTVQVPGGCVSHRRTGETLAEVVAQWPELLKAAAKDEQVEAESLEQQGTLFTEAR